MNKPRTNIFTNAIANFAGQSTAVLVGILLTPFLLARMGESLYGVWALVVAIQGLGGLLDFGMSTSVVRYVAAHRTKGEHDEINRVVSSAFVLHMVIGIAAFALISLFAWQGLGVLHLHPRLVDTARNALLAAAGSLMLGLPVGVLGSLLTALRQYEKSNAINILTSLLTAAASFGAVAVGYGPTALVAINGVGLIGSGLAKWALACRSEPYLRVSIIGANTATLKRIGSYSVWLFVLDAAKKIFYNADAVLVSAFTSVSRVTDYNLGFKPASAISYLSGPFVSVFLPAASELQARNDLPRLQRLLTTGTRVAIAMTLPAAIWLLTLGPHIMALWVGDGHASALPVLYVFLGVFLVTAAQNPSGVILRGIGQVRTLAIMVIFEYIANVLLSILLIPRIGPVGAAIGTFIPGTLTGLIGIPILACRALSLSYPSFAARSYIGPVVAAAPTLLVMGLYRWYFATPGLVSVTLGGVLAIGTYAVSYLVTGAGGDERTLIRSAALRLRGTALASSDR